MATDIVYYEFEADDDSFSLNIRELGFMPVGRYRGFDFGATFTTTLPFAGGLVLGHHSTGYDYPLNDPNASTRSDKTGIVKTHQGSIIARQNPVTLAVAANATANPRLDLVYVTHEHINATGGMAPVYAILAGAPAPTPLPPAVPDPNRDTVIGLLLVPAGSGGAITTIDISQWQPKRTPNFAEDNTIPHTDLPNEFTRENVFYKGIISNNFIPAGYTGSAITIPSGSAGCNNFFLGAIAPSYAATTDITGWFSAGQEITIYSLSTLILKSTANGGKFLTAQNRDIIIEFGDTFSVKTYDISGTVYFAVTSAPEYRNKTNKFRATQSFSHTAGTVDVSGGLSYAPGGNTVTTNSVNLGNVRWIQSYDYTGNAVERGTVLVLDHFNSDGFTFNNRTVFEHDTGLLPAPPAGYKRIKCPNARNAVIFGRNKLLLVETNTHWEVIAISAELGYWNPLTLINGFTNSLPSSPAGIKIKDSFWTLRGTITSGAATNLPANVYTVIANLPSGLNFPTPIQLGAQIWQNGNTPRAVELQCSLSIIELKPIGGGAINGANHVLPLGGITFDMSQF